MNRLNVDLPSYRGYRFPVTIDQPLRMVPLWFLSELLVRSVKRLTKSLELGEYRVSGGGPHEGLGVLDSVVHVRIELGFELSHRLE